MIRGTKDIVSGLGEGWVLTQHLAVQTASISNGQAGEGQSPRAIEEKLWKAKPDDSFSFLNAWGLMVMGTLPAPK